MSPASDLFAKARAALLVNAPFWGVLSLRLAPVEDSSIQTMKTDGVSIHYNPDFVKGLSRSVLRSAIAHETLHCAALHHTRREGRDLRRWNIACYHAINPPPPCGERSMASPGSKRSVALTSASQ